MDFWNLVTNWENYESCKSDIDDHEMTLVWKFDSFLLLLLRFWWNCFDHPTKGWFLVLVVCSSIALTLVVKLKVLYF